MQVKDILGSKPSGVITITADQTLQQASELLSKHNIGAVVIVDSRGVPQGILSERDIVRSFAKDGTSAPSRTVTDVMTKDIIIAIPDDDISYLTSTMTAKRIRHLPVLDGGNLVGIVSIGDVVKAQLEYYEGEARSLLQYITGGHA